MSKYAPIPHRDVGKNIAHRLCDMLIQRGIAFSVETAKLTSLPPVNGFVRITVAEEHSAVLWSFTI